MSQKNVMLKLSLTLAACMFRRIACSQFAGQPIEKAVDELITGQIAANAPGVAVLIARNNQIIYNKAFGSANLELNTALEPDMIFRIGSVTKPFTAIAILQLVEQGKIGLQDSLQRYLPDFPAKGSTITIENLLTHTSGMMDYSDADTTHNPYIERQDFTAPEIIKYVNDRLVAHPSLEGRYDMIPIGTDKFKLRNASPECSFQFIRDSAGTITEFIVTQKGIFNWVRVDDEFINDKKGRIKKIVVEQLGGVHCKKIK